MVEVGGETYFANKAKEPIDIILPTHGNLDLCTAPCVYALYQNTRSPFHLIVVDDSTSSMDDGTDKTREYFEGLQVELSNITFVHSPVPYKSGNQIFNIGLAHANHRFVATVMNSVQVEPDWDVVPVQFMAENSKVGIIGIKCLKFGWPKGQDGLIQDGLIESAGIKMVKFAPVDLGRDEPGHRRTSTYPCFSLQWAFTLLRKEAVIGNLDEDLFEGFAGWDDIDNTLVLRSKGWEAWYCGLGCGYHRTHATRGSQDPQVRLRNKRNGEKFYKRWGYWEQFRQDNPHTIEYFPNGEVQFIADADKLPLRTK